MPTARSNSREHFIWLLLRFTVFLGVTNHSFDREKHQFVYSRGAFIYRVSLHSVSAILLIVNFNEMLTDSVHLLEESQFVMELGLVCTYTYVIVLVHSLMSEWANHRKGTKPFNELLKVRIENVLNSEAQASIQRNAWNLVYLKTLSVILLTVTFISTTITQSRLTFRSTVGIIAVDILQLVYISIQYQFTLAMLYGGYLFKILNLRLFQIVRHINGELYISRKRSQRLSEELIRLGNCHSTLHKLLIRIKDIYQFDLLVILSTLFILQAFAIFFVLVSWNGNLGKVTVATYVIECGKTFVSTIDLLIILYICGDCVQACNDSRDVLRDWRSSPVLHGSLDNDIDTLCFQLVRQKMRLTICGMFDLDVHTGPVMIEGLMLKVILLTQIGYHELR